MITFLLFELNVFSQKKVSFQQNLPTSSPVYSNATAVLVPTTNIVRVFDEDTSKVKIELLNCFYDFKRGFLPYYSVQKETPLNQSANPHLVVKNVSKVEQKTASLLQKYYAKYIGSDFKLTHYNAYSTGKNLNNTLIIPFRYQNGQFEELVSYDITWSYTNNVDYNAKAQSSAASFTNSSVLATGNWFKIGITTTGVYKIDKSFFTSMGIDVSTFDPRNIRIYGNGGAMLPERNKDFRYDDLQENAIRVIGESDGIFDASDYVLFYATGTTSWKYKSSYDANPANKKNNLLFTSNRNLYSDTSFYFITTSLGAGKRIIDLPSLNITNNATTNTYDYYNTNELATTNIMNSGRFLFGQYFDVVNSFNFGWNDAGYVVNDTIRSIGIIAGRSSSSLPFTLTGNGINVADNVASVNLLDWQGLYANMDSLRGKALNTSPNAINLNLIRNTPNGIGWVQKVMVNARANLLSNVNQFNYRDSRVAAPGNITSFQLTAYNTQTLNIWNVSDILNVSNQKYVQTGTSISYTCATDSVIEFAAFTTANTYTPSYVGKITNQNIHNIAQADYVLVTHPLFLSHAQRLANLHQQNEGLTYAIVTTEQIYNEFSSGKPDVSAIRDFTRMLYSRNIGLGKQVKYLCLLGNGSYMNRFRNINGNTNLIPTYQSWNSTDAVGSLTSDDFFGMMDPNEGFDALNEFTGNPQIVDLGVGRIIAVTQSDMEGVVSKIETYYSKDGNAIFNQGPTNCFGNTLTMRDWRNWLVLIADAGEGGLFSSDCESLCNSFTPLAPNINVEKIYLDTYQSFSTAGNVQYPDADNEFQNRIANGALLVNYVGHGSELSLSAARLIDINKINAWTNKINLPIFVTATCEFTRYDNPARVSAGELCLLNPSGGAVSLFSTCRLAIASTNLVLNTVFYNYFFSKIAGKIPTLGDVIKLTKAYVGTNIYFGNFHLFGDPAITPAIPTQKAKTQKINLNNVSITSSDTLTSLKKMTISGAITDTLGSLLTNFNGIIYPSVFNKVSVLTGTIAGLGTTFTVNSQKDVIYKGKSSVINGNFSFSFIVPKDIGFAQGRAKISYYATNGTIDASGSYTQIIAGGYSSSSVIVDNQGPSMTLFMNSTNFVEGGTTNESPIFYANLIDSSGINMSGLGIGHDLSVVLDANTSSQIILNTYYEPSINSYQSGRVRYPFNQLSNGPHQLTFKAWDIQNNSSVGHLDFVVANSAQLALTHVLNYPNPFTTATKFYFEYNQPCNPLQVSLQIFTISGKVVKTFHTSVSCDGFRPEAIPWDGKDDYGDKLGRGVYIYKLAIVDNQNQKAEKIEKLVILN